MTLKANELTNSYRGAGIIAADPELRSVGERQVCNLRLAVPGLAGRDEPFGFLTVSVWGTPGAACAEHLTRKMIVSFSGALEVRHFKREDHSDGHALQIPFATVQFPPLPPREDDSAHDEDLPVDADRPLAGAQTADADIPF